MRCGPYVFIFIFSSTLKASEVTGACTGGAVNTTNVRLKATSDSSACLDIFTTRMNYLSAEAQESSEECRSVATDKRHSLLSEAHASLVSSVRGIQERLLDCSFRKDSIEDCLRYFHCMKDTIDEVRTPLEEVGKNSSRRIDVYTRAVVEINREEQTCVEVAVRKSKQGAEQAFVEYRKCLTIASGCPCGSSTASASPTSPVTTTEEDDSQFDGGGEVRIEARSGKASVDFVAVIGAVVLVVIVLTATYMYRNNEHRRPPIRLQNMP